jgi:hypothetical protein
LPALTTSPNHYIVMTVLSLLLTDGDDETKSHIEDD